MKQYEKLLCVWPLGQKSNSYQISVDVRWHSILRIEFRLCLWSRWSHRCIWFGHVSRVIKYFNSYSKFQDTYFVFRFLTSISYSTALTNDRNNYLLFWSIWLLWNRSYSTTIYALFSTKTNTNSFQFGMNSFITH